jgi:hypothetical protein
MSHSESPAEGFDPETWYTQLQVHVETERWIEAIAICYRILNVEPDYRDVPQLLERARKQLALEREQSRIAKEAWRGTLTPVMERTPPRPRRWRLVFLIVGLGALLLSAVLIVVVPRFQGQLPGLRGRPEPRATAGSAEIPRAPMAVTEMQSYINSEGRFLLKYPQAWGVKESPSEGQPLRIVIITPEARDEPERITIIFAPGSGQSAEQVWISGLGFIQSVQDEDTEDWLLGEAFSASVGGYHARQVPFRYTHAPSETDWQGLIAGVVYDSVNYALIAEAPLSRWSWSWPVFEQVLNSIQFQ